MSVLDEIIAVTEKEVSQRREKVPLDELVKRLEDRPPGRPFAEALAVPGISLIAEFKRSSPSAGLLREGAVVKEIVQAYEQGGAAALSVLTEKKFFGGSLEDLQEAWQATKLPVLRKDFIVDEYQVFESAAAGADALLLIIAALEPEQLSVLYNQARELQLDVLVEVHDQEELEQTLELGADVIGINNRDLSDFSVNVERTFELLADVPAGKTVVSESGINSRRDVDELERIGVDAVLVGGLLMQSEDPLATTRALTGFSVETEG